MTSDYPEHLNPFGEEYKDPYSLKNPFDEDYEEIVVRRPPYFSEAMPSPPPRVRRSLSLTPRKQLSTPWNTPSTPTLRRQESTSTLRRQGSISRFGKTRAAPPPPVRNGTSQLSTPEEKADNPFQPSTPHTSVADPSQPPTTHTRTAPSPPVRSETSLLLTSQSTPNFSTLQTPKSTQKIATPSSSDVNNGNERIDLSDKSSRTAPPRPIQFDTSQIPQLTQKPLTATSPDQTPLKIINTHSPNRNNQRVSLSDKTPTPKKTIDECEASDHSIPPQTETRIPSYSESTSQSFSNFTFSSLETTSKSSTEQMILSTSSPSTKGSQLYLSDSKSSPTDSSQNATTNSTMKCTSITTDQSSNSLTTLSSNKPQIKTLVSTQKPIEYSFEATSRCSPENSLETSPPQSTTQPSTTEPIQQLTPQTPQKVTNRFSITATSQMTMQSNPKVTSEQCSTQFSSQMKSETREETVKSDIQSVTPSDSQEQPSNIFPPLLPTNTQQRTPVLTQKPVESSTEAINRSSKGTEEKSPNQIEPQDSRHTNRNENVSLLIIEEKGSREAVEGTEKKTSGQEESLEKTKQNDFHFNETEPLISKSGNINGSSQITKENSLNQLGPLKRSEENAYNQIESLRIIEEDSRPTEALKRIEKSVLSQRIEDNSFIRTGSLKRSEQNVPSSIHPIKTNVRQVSFQDEVEEFKDFSDSE
ncbi:hypothetical protein WDU94_000185 [Cyamophila willieti]